MTSQSNLLFLGDSLTAFHDWSGFGSHHNAGIAGDTTDGLLHRLHYTLAKDPRCVVLMIGINDLLQGQRIDRMKHHYQNILQQLQSIETVVILSLLPVASAMQTIEINEKVILLNWFLKNESQQKGLIYLDLYNMMVDRDGGIKEALTSDGVHLTPEAYALWENALHKRLKQFYTD